jgi:hypothetical protein
VPSGGTRENVGRVVADPRELGYGQLDTFAHEKGKLPAKEQPVLVRSDDLRECLFLVTRNKQFSAFGDIQANAAKLRFILPPKDGGSAGTFEFLQKVDPDGLGKAANVTYAKSTEEAVRQALSAEDTVTLFVQIADPATPIFATVASLGGQMLPVIDRNILRQQVDGQKIYYAEETEIAQPKWVKSGKKVVTACTPSVVFAGNPDRLEGDKAKDQRDVIATVQKLRAEDLVPKQSWYQRALKRTKEVSAQSAETLIEYSEKARQAAAPAMEKAKEAGGKAVEAAKPYYERAKEATKEAVDKAKEAVEKARQGAGSGQGPAPAPSPAPSTPPKQ